MAAERYITAARYRMLGWPHYERASDSKIWSFVYLIAWVSISLALYIK